MTYNNNKISLLTILVAEISQVYYTFDNLIKINN